MQEVTIKYKDTKTLMLLRDLSKYLDFVVSKPKQEKQETTETKKETIEMINGVPFIPGDNSIDTSDLNKIFTGRNIDAKKTKTTGMETKKVIKCKC